MASVEESEAYDRGVVAGDIAARLTSHDKHFLAINGSLAEIAKELGLMSLTMQRLADQAVADAAKAVATARALKEAEDARRLREEDKRDRIDRHWLTVPRLAGIISILVGASTLYFFVFHK